MATNHTCKWARYLAAEKKVGLAEARLSMSLQYGKHDEEERKLTELVGTVRKKLRWLNDYMYTLKCDCKWYHLQ